MPLTSSHTDAGDVGRDLHAILALLCIQQQVEAARPSRGQLPQHDVLRHTLHRVALAVGGGLHQHVHLGDREPQG